VHLVGQCTLWGSAPCEAMHPVGQCTLWGSAPCGAVHLVRQCTLWGSAPGGAVHLVGQCTWMKTTPNYPNEAVNLLDILSETFMNNYTLLHSVLCNVNHNISITILW